MEYLTANSHHIDQLVQMRLEYIEEDLGPISDEIRKKMSVSLPCYLRKHLDKDLYAFVAIENETIVATAWLLKIEKPSSPNFINGVVGNVLNVYTKPEYRNRGAAYRLIMMLLSFAQERKYDYVELKATQEGYSLYKRCGFIDAVHSYHNMIFTRK